MSEDERVRRLGEGNLDDLRRASVREFQAGGPPGRAIRDYIYALEEAVELAKKAVPRGMDEYGNAPPCMAFWGRVEGEG